MTWEELLARPRHRDAAGVLVVLEEVDLDAGTATYRRGGETHTVRRADAARPATDDGRGRLVAASVVTRRRS